MRQIKKAPSFSSKLALLKPVPVYYDKITFVSGTPLPAIREMYTPNRLYYVVNHFPVPRLEAKKWKLRIHGKIEQSIALSYEDILRLPSKTLTVTLECAGNGRGLYDPPISAAKISWEHHGVSNALWKGVPLVTILDMAKLKTSAKEVVFKGTDHGIDNALGSKREIHYERSLPLKKALHPDTLLAYQMNGETLPEAHGFPLRLVVPGWYGMASVKWLTDMTVIGESFKGFYQTERYVYEWTDEPGGGIPATQIKIKSLITQPLDGEILNRGEIRVRGVAWAGDAKVKKVEVSSDGGLTWRKARLLSRSIPYGWCQWEYRWKAFASGISVLMVRAVDEQGNMQPFKAKWNRQGFANNSIHTINVWIS